LEKRGRISRIQDPSTVLFLDVDLDLDLDVVRIF